MRKTLLALALLTSTAFAHPAIFQDLTFEQAQARAVAEKKRLLVDATASWCGPCHQMDETTWVDPTVTAWCQDKVLAIQLDVDGQKELAKKLRISAMPTVILFDGEKELDRMVGYREGPAFLDWLKMADAGQHESDRLGEKAKAGDLTAHLEWAAALLSEGRVEAAAEQYLWLWDHMLEKDPSLVGVRHSFFRNELKTLVKQSPATREALVQRLGALQTQVEKGDATRAQLQDWLTLSEVLDGGGAALDYVLKNPQAPVFTPVSSRIFSMLVARDDWRPAGLFLTDPVAEAQRALDLEKHGAGDFPPELRERYLSYLKRSTSKKLLDLLRANLAASRVAEAKTLKAMILQRDPSPESLQAVEKVEKY